MSNLYETTEKWEFWEILYTIWINKDGSPVMDLEWHIKTNIHWLIVEDPSNIFDEEIKTIQVDKDKYNELDIKIASDWTKTEVIEIITNIAKKVYA